MLFEKLADGIMKHYKLIICLWIVLLIVSVPFLYKVLIEPEDILEYDMTKMIDKDSESVQGLVIIEQTDYFYHSEIDNQLLLVIECQTKEDVDNVDDKFIPSFTAKMNEKYGVGYNVKAINRNILMTANQILFIADGSDATVIYVPLGVTVNIDDVITAGGYDFTVKAINTKIMETADHVQFIADGSDATVVVIPDGVTVNIDDTIWINGNTYTLMSMGLQSKNQDTYGLPTTPGIVLLAIGFTDDRNVSPETNPIRDVVSDTKAATGFSPTTYVTGNMAIGQDTLDSSMEDIMKIDPFSILLVLVLIGLFFRSLISSATPPLTIGFAYGATMIFIYALAQVMQIYYVTSTIVLVSMLGAGCDYCIFIIARYREERKAGKDKEGALRESIIWAGESITTSGISVIIGFGVISFCTFAMVSTMGMILAAGVLFALIAALTLIPSVLMLVGDRIFYPSTMETYDESSKTMQGWYGKMSEFGKKYFKNSAKISIKYAGVIVVAVLLLTIPLAYVTLTEKTSYDMISIMPECESKDGVNAIVDNSNGGLIMPTYVLMETKSQIATINHQGIPTGDPDNPYLGTLTWTGGYQTALAYFGNTTYMEGAGPILAGSLPYYITQISSDNIASITGIISSQYIIEHDMMPMLMLMLPSTLADAVAKIDYMRQMGMIPLETEYQALDYLLNYNMGSISNYIDGIQYVKVTVTVKDQPMSEKSMGTIRDIENGTDDFMNSESGQGLFASSMVTGSVVAVDEISKIVNDQFIWIEIAVVILIFILLFFVMRSYFTPMRSIITIVMSVVWTLGVTHLLFGHLLGMPITWIVPIILFVICLGLGMDYDILLTTRIKENVMKGMSNDEAILHAVEKSGAVITICGFIMGGAFLTMTLSTSPMLMEFGFALGFAILVDALFIRTYVVPAVMHLMGKWNWIGPSFLSIKKEE